MASVSSTVGANNTNHGYANITSPYTLSLIIHRGEDLPIADATTSDPFVVATLDEKVILRTPTIYKNLNPIWDVSTPKVPLLWIRNSVLYLRIYDEDKSKDSDYLGLVTIPLKSVNLNSNEVLISPLEQASKSHIVAKGYLHYSIFLEKNDNIVKVVPLVNSAIGVCNIEKNSDACMDDSPDGNESEARVSVSDELHIDPITSIIKLSIPKFEWVLSDPILQCLKEYMARQAFVEKSFSSTVSLKSKKVAKHGTIRCNRLFADFIADIGFLLVLSPVERAKDKFGSSDAVLEYLSDSIIRRMPHFVSSTLIDLSESTQSPSKFMRSNPLVFTGVELILDEEGPRQSYILQVESRHAMWMLVKWLQLAHDVWNKKIFDADIPVWATSCNGIFQCPAVLSQSLDASEDDLSRSEGSGLRNVGSTNTHSWSGTVVLSLSRMHQVRIIDTGTKMPLHTASLVSLRSIIMSVDTSSGYTHALEIDTLYTNLNPSAASSNSESIQSQHLLPGQQSPSVGVSEIYASGKYGPKGNFGVRRFFRRKADELGLTQTARGVASKTMSTAGSVARTLAAADAGATLIAAQSTVLSAGKDLATIVTTTGSAISGAQVTTFVVVKCGSLHQVALVPTSSTDSCSPWDCQLCVDLNLKDEKVFPVLATARSNALKIARRSAAGGLGDDDSTLQSDNSIEYHKNVDIFLYHGTAGTEALVAQKQLKLSKILAAATISDDDKRDEHSGGVLRSELDLSLDAQLGLRVTIKFARGILQPSKKNLLQSGGIYIKCKLADATGRSVNSLPGQRTPTVKVSPNPDWGEHDIFLGANEGLGTAHYVRIKIMGGPLISEECLGIAFIPVDHFIKAEAGIDKVYSVLRDDSVSGVVAPGTKSLGSDGIGELCLRLNKISEKNDDLSKSVKLKIRTSIRENTVYNSVWPAEASLSSHISAESETGYMLAPTFDALALLDAKALNFFGEDKGGSHDSVDIQDPNSIVLQPDREIVIFENQRRQVYPPFDWGHGNLLVNERGRFSDETGFESYSIKDLQEYLPPAGFEWCGAWILDTVYTDTDEDGWCYGMDFLTVMANYRRGKSTTVKSRPVRRRKWIRICRQIKPEGMSFSVYETRNLAPIPQADKVEELARLSKSTSETTNSRSSAQFSRGLSTKRVSASSVNLDEKVLEIAVFENQRRAILPPYDWGDGNLLLNERTRFSCESGHSIFEGSDLSQAKPPHGFEWVTGDAWRVDKKYTDTDDDGWAFGISFKFLSSNYKSGKSASSPVGRSVRRRRWIRSVCMKADAVRDDVEAHVARDVLPVAFLSEALAKAGLTGAVSGLSWRSEVSSSDGKHTAAVLDMCRERAAAASPIVIPWTQVMSTTVISPSILNLTVAVHRFFPAGDRDKGGSKSEVFREVTMDVFVCNCPAITLQSLIHERIEFAKFRDDMKVLISTGNLTGKYWDSNNRSGSAGSVETADLSLGSSTIAELDNNVLAIEAHLDALLTSPRLSSDHLEEYSLLSQRLCRLQLYTATLLLANLEGHHKYDEDDPSRILQEDLEVLAQIEQEDEVSTATNRIEFLLDTAEMRLRDAALCGWASRNGGGLERAIEILVNGYFFEMVVLLSNFFDVKNSKASNIQGLQSKINLITAFMKNNDRLAIILSSALRPYNVTISPRPLLSLYLNFDSLLSWYTTVLQYEMRGIVENALSVWKDPQQNASGQVARYKFAASLPWVPLRQGGESGIFRSLLPEDTVEYLNRYINFARLSNDDIAPSFRSVIWKVDAKVNQSYAASFVFLAEAYWRELCSQDWSNTTANPVDAASGSDAADQKREEITEWLFSVANDSRRIISTAAISNAIGLPDSLTSASQPSRSQDLRQSIASEQDGSSSSSSSSSGGGARDADGIDKASVMVSLYDLIDQAYSVFSRCLDRSVEVISCVIFRLLAGDMSEPGSFLGHSFFSLWESDAKSGRNRVRDSEYGKDNHGDGVEDGEEEQFSRSGPFAVAMEDLESLLEFPLDQLDSYCYFKLLCVCAHKVVLRYLLLLQEASALGRKYRFDGPEVMAIESDVHFAKSCFDVLVGKSGNAVYRDAVHSHFRPLDQALTIIGAESSTSPKLLAVLASVRKVASGKPESCKALSKFLLCCLSLRHSSPCLRSSGRLPATSSASATGTPAPAQRRGSLMSMFAGQSVKSAAPADGADDDSAAGAGSGGDATLLAELEILAARDPNYGVILDIECDSEPQSFEGELFCELCHKLSAEVKAFDLLDGSWSVAALDVFFCSGSPTLRARHSVGNKGMKGFSAFFSQLFSSAGSNPVDAACAAHSASMSSAQSAVRSSGLSAAVVQQMKASRSDFIEVSCLKMFNLFCFDSWSGKPKCFVRASLSLGGSQSAADASPSATSVSTQLCADTLDPDWTGQQPLLLPMIPFATSAAPQLLLELFYKLRLRGDELIGSVRVPLSAVDLAPVDNEDFSLTFDCSAKVRDAVSRVTAAGKPLPTMHLSVRLVKE